jgi:hypothetical protein
VKNIFLRRQKKPKTAKKTKKINTARFGLKLIALACIILVGASVWLWWTKVVMNPDRALQDAISNSLKAKSISKHVIQSGANGEIDQTSYLSFFPPSVSSQTSTVLTQGRGSNSASITTETIGTPEADYVRYAAYEGGQGIPGTERLESLLGVWAKRTQSLSQGEELTFLNETLFGVIPFADLDEGQRGQLIAMIDEKNIYQYSSAERKIEGNRPVYVYDLTINPADLVGMIKEYVQLAGAGDSSQLNPAQYQGLGKLQVQLTVDIFSRQVVEVAYPNGRVETYTGQNLYRPVDIPADTIPVEELQKRLQAGRPV